MSSIDKMLPLTVEEQVMAEEYFYLVDDFLRRKHLDYSEYYDVVIFGYLQATQRECRNQDPPEKRKHRSRCCEHQERQIAVTV